MTTARNKTKVTEEAIDELVTKLLDADEQAKAWKIVADQAKEQLTSLHRDGLVATKFEHSGYTLTLQSGRKTTVWDEEAKLSIQQLQLKLKKAGHGTDKQGDPFWVPRKLKAD
jgi:predicted ArsR family transcriptional regulator